MAHDVKLAAVDLNLLVALKALLNERHVTRAARQLGLSQSATSHALSRLRDLYGDPLLVRSGRVLELTPRAVALLPQLERGLGELQASLSGQEGFEPRRARLPFRVGAADFPQALLSGPLLSLLHAEAPGVALQLTSYPDLREQLEAGAIDVAITVKTRALKMFVEQPLFSDGFVCLLRKGHPALRQGRFNLQRYLALEHLLVAPGGTAGNFVDTELSRRGLTRRVALQISSFLVAPQLVAESDLITTGPELLLRRVSATHPVVLLKAPLRLPRFELVLVWHARRDHDPAHVWMRDVVVRAARALKAGVATWLPRNSSLDGSQRK
ncbi:MAG TPA: LysR family transcriptional regulator [Polyangia bacterium]|nr:LysR family transcriptional regulator [Polyangia bacterium]